MAFLARHSGETQHWIKGVKMETKPLLRDELTDRLRELVVQRRSDAPVRITPERELAETLGVSRISLRHALKNLVTEGLLVQRQGSGTYIVPSATLSTIQVLVASDIKQNDPFYSEFLAELTHFCADNSVQLQVSRESTSNGPMDSGAPLVIVGMLGVETVKRVRQTGRLIISTQYYPDFLDLTQLLFDDSRIGWEAAGILVEHGHTRAIHLGGPSAYASAAERTRGFVDGAAKHGIKVVTLHGKMNWKSGHELGTEVVRLVSGDDPPTAVFASNDWMALGLMHRLAEERIRVPDDLSIIGCDDIHMAGEVSPGLATFSWDMSFIVRELFNVIDAETAAESRTHKRILLPANFVMRDSLGPGPQAAEKK
jgi:DNA-binding LacI/PurR family transcriptional regulator